MEGDRPTEGGGARESIRAGEDMPGRNESAAEVVQSRIGVETERGDPLGQMKISARARAQAVTRDATALLTACGLALRSFD